MHIITGEIRKQPYTKEGQNNSGSYKMYIIELSESMKDRQTNERIYTNYSATFFASSDAMRGWYDESFQAGKVISVSCDMLKINNRDYNGQTYVTLQMEQPRLQFSQRGEVQTPQQTQQQPRQQPPRQNPPQGNNQPPMDFDDDIPFAMVGLQYGKHRIYAL